ncbi:hypothetical protein [Actinokineospora sp. NBRC 105648]|uniref:hypothetical protein n=1 Tax=Actinokineospora sp. NBRC 105648 TaxID=3032206 RepID=UPI0024A40E08|nr:hypothetical protein [Actinokineospora sp. NBRC 105648]GLZ40902.1 hypothetical protein Acsp05_45260 [Actinokineospora sp. NBRC 105648]
MATRRWHGTSTRGSAARIVTGIGALFALIEVVFILLAVLGANAGNAFYKFIQSLADPLALFFPGLFPIADPTVATIVNYGLAAVFWLVITGLIARLLR